MLWCKLAKKLKFDETIDIAINLGVDPKHSDQIVKGVVKLPHGNGKIEKIDIDRKISGIIIFKLLIILIYIHCHIIIIN